MNQNYNFQYWNTEDNETNYSTQHSWGMGWSASAPTTTTTTSMTTKMMNTTVDRKSTQSVATIVSNQHQTNVSETETVISTGQQNKKTDIYCLPIFSPPPSNVYSDSVLEWNSRNIVLNANYC